VHREFGDSRVPLMCVLCLSWFGVTSASTFACRYVSPTHAHIHSYMHPPYSVALHVAWTYTIDYMPLRLLRLLTACFVCLLWLLVACRLQYVDDGESTRSLLPALIDDEVTDPHPFSASIIKPRPSMPSTDTAVACRIRWWCGLFHVADVTCPSVSMCVMCTGYVDPDASLGGTPPIPPPA
jgi:hypothetical protein